MPDFKLRREIVDIGGLYSEFPLKNESAVELAHELGSRALWLLDFSTVTSVGTSFTHSLMKTLNKDRQHGYANDSLIAYINANEDVRFTIDLVNKSLGTCSAVGGEEGLDLVPPLQGPKSETFQLAQEFTKNKGIFTIDDLVRLSHVSQKPTQLKIYQLIWGGMVARIKANVLYEKSGHSNTYVHRAIIDEDLAIE